LIPAGKGRIELVRGLHNLRPRHRGCVATIGNYDGVHRGHQHMLAAVRRKADELNLPATVVTFEPTPREFFEGSAAPARLMRLREKLDALSLYGIDRVGLLPFDEHVRNLPAADFGPALLADPSGPVVVPVVALIGDRPGRGLDGGPPALPPNRPFDRGADERTAPTRCPRGPLNASTPATRSSGVNGRLYAKS